MVEANLVGAVVPLLVTAFAAGFFRSRFHWLRIGKFTLFTFVVVALVGSVWGAIYNVLSMPGYLYIIVWFFVVIWYSRVRFVRADFYLSMGELYAIGTLGVFLDDAIRTLLGFLNVPIIGLKIDPNIWGAAGPLDGIFLSGMMQAFLFLLMSDFFRGGFGRRP